MVELIYEHNLYLQSVETCVNYSWAGQKAWESETK
jgi:hypothetical protein